MFNNVRIIASTLVPLSLALCIAWWNRHAHCFTQCCVTLVVMLEYQRALCKWHATLCTTHVARYYIIRVLHWRIWQHMLFFWPFHSNKVSISWRFALKQPSKHAHCARLHHPHAWRREVCITWPTVHLWSHPMFCWWGTLGPRWLLPALMPSPARDIAERGGEGGKLRCPELGKKASQWRDSNSCSLNPVLGHTEDFFPKQIRLL